MKTDYFAHVGCKLFSFKAGIEIQSKAPEEVIFHMIKHELIHFKRNDLLTWTFVPVIIAVFTNIILNSRFPISAPVLGLAAGMVSFGILRRWIEKRAILTTIQRSSREENEAVRNWFRPQINDSDASFQEKCLLYIERLIKFSDSEIANLYSAHLKPKS